MLYTPEEIVSNYNELCNTDTALKILISERFNYLGPKYKGFTKREHKEITLFGIEDYIKYRSELENTYPIIRINHVPPQDLQSLDDIGAKYDASKLLHPIKKLDADFFEMKGKKYEQIRRYKNLYDKKKFTVQSHYNKLEDVMALLKYWEENKRKETTMTFVGYDRSFFKKFFDECNEKYDILPLFFYDDSGTLLAFQVMEHVKNNFWLLHTRKTNRFDHPNLNLYVDIYTFRKIYEENGQQDFLVDMGLEMGKLTGYKVQRFPTYAIIDAFNLKMVSQSNTKKTNKLLSDKDTSSFEKGDKLKKDRGMKSNILF